MTEVNFKTPFISLLGVILLAVLSLHNFSAALNGFISEPLFWASGFACGELSFLLLIMKFTEYQRATLVNLTGEVLAFCYGVFVCVVIALLLQDISLFSGAILTIVIITSLMLLIDFVYSERFNIINRWLATPADNKLKKISVVMLQAAVFIFLVLYVVFIIFK